MLRRISGFAVLASLFLTGSVLADSLPPPPVPTIETPNQPASFGQFDKNDGKYIESYHDKFKFQTDVAVSDNFVRSETNWAPILMAPGKLLFYDGNGHYTHIGFTMAMIVPDAGSVNQSPVSIILTFQNRASVWEHRGDHEFNWLVDGKPLPWITSEYDFSKGNIQEYGNDEHLEINYIVISPDVLKQLASAKVIDCRFGTTEFYFGAIQFWILNKFESLYESLTQGRATPIVTPS